MNAQKFTGRNGLGSPLGIETQASTEGLNHWAHLRVGMAWEAR